jgi:thiamine biosynthesis lipoprotein
MGMRRSRGLQGIGVWLALVSSGLVAAPLQVQREGVLGTSFEMQVDGDDARASRAVDAALDEVARLERQLSTWRKDSALSRYNDGDLSAERLPEPVAEVLAQCERWRRDSEGAFSCRLGALIAQWRQADASDRLPERAGLRRQARALAALPAPAKGPLDPALGLRFDVDGIAKGYILDRALQRARRAAPKTTGIRIDIGGDAVYWGHPETGDAWQVEVADAKQPLDNQPGIARLRLRSHAIAASGHHSRGYTVGRRQLSHILDPQDGWPLAYAPGATVVAADAATADALATALTVMPIREGIALVDRIEGAAALVVSDAGIPFASARWPRLLASGDGDTRAASVQLLIDYEIPAIDAARYRQPYLAMWIEDEAGQPVRQLHVLGDRSRWLSELPRWWRHYGRNDPAGALGIARPTRAPGHYTLAWDGRNDRGDAMPAGRYLLRVEAAREHGGHEDIALPFPLGGATSPLQHTGQSEIGRLRLRYDKT